MRGDSSCPRCGGTGQGEGGRGCGWGALRPEALADETAARLLEAARARQDTPLSPEQRRAIGIDETPAADWTSSDEEDGGVEERAEPLYVCSLRDGGVIVTASSYATGVLESVEVVLTAEQVDALTTRLLDHRDATRRRKTLLQEEADWQKKRSAEKQASRDADAAALANGTKTRAQLWEENTAIPARLTSVDIGSIPIPEDEDVVPASGQKTRAQFWKENAAVPGRLTLLEVSAIPGPDEPYPFRRERLMVPAALMAELGQPQTTDELCERLTEKLMESDRLRQDALDALGGVVLAPDHDYVMRRLRSLIADNAEQLTAIRALNAECVAIKAEIARWRSLLGDGPKAGE